MKIIKVMAALIVLPVGLGGCATVINGTSQDMQVAPGELLQAISCLAV